MTARNATWLSDLDLAARFGVHRTTVWGWVRRNGFPAPVRLSPQLTRWRLADVEAWEAAQAAAA